MPLLLLALLAVASSAAPNSCRGQPNTLPFIPGTETVKARAPNGVLTEVKGVTPPLLVVHVYGNATQRGHAYGALLKPFLAPLLSQFWAWMDSQVEEIARFAPAWLVDVLVTEGARAALDLQFAAMYPWISSEFLDEVHAAAKAAGVEHADLLRLQMVPELVKAHCSMVGAWDAATPSGKLVQLRALDWAMNSPLQQWPLVTVYHTSAHSAFSTLGWPGFMGALTGMSSAPVGVCEKVWLSYDGSDSRFGLPFNLLLRDILEFDTNTEAAIARITVSSSVLSLIVTRLALTFFISPLIFRRPSAHAPSGSAWDRPLATSVSFPTRRKTSRCTTHPISRWATTRTLSCRTWFIWTSTSSPAATPASAPCYRICTARLTPLCWCAM